MCNVLLSSAINCSWKSYNLIFLRNLSFGVAPGSSPSISSINLFIPRAKPRGNLINPKVQ